MEAVINKYHNGKIYTIRSYQTNTFYIGSTCQPLYKRLCQHRMNYKMFLAGKYHSVTSFNILQFDDHYIELLEEYVCENKEQLTKKEGELIREHKDSCVNRYIPGRTDKEWRLDNIEKLQIQKKQYNDDNKDKMKQYYLHNKEDIKIKNKNNYEKNKNLLQQQRSVTYLCECGIQIKLYDKERHSKSKKHIKNIT